MLTSSRFLHLQKESNASPTLLAPVLKSSTWRELKDLATSSLSTVLYLFMWWIILSNNNNELEVTPNKTLQNRNSVNSLFSKFSKSILPGSWNHKNLTKSLCDGCKPIWRNAFYISPTKYAMLWTRNRSNIPNKAAVKEGPGYKQSFKLWFPFAFALASNTIRNFVVAFSCRMTGLCGK